MHIDQNGTRIDCCFEAINIFFLYLMHFVSTVYSISSATATIFSYSVNTFWHIVEIILSITALSRVMNVFFILSEY